MWSQGFYYIYSFCDDVASCLCAVAEEKRTFTPAHLQAVGDHDFNVINVIDRVQRGEDITKVPGILVTNGHAPESIFGVNILE